MGALEAVEELASAVAQRRRIRLWDVQLGGRPGQTIVRVFVDADGGVDLDTVAEVSEELSRGLDLHDPIPGRYTLEVSSPGLERTLRRPEHFKMSQGARVVVKTKHPVTGDSNRLEATIEGADGERVSLRSDDGTVNVPYEAIRSARTVFEWH